MRKIKKYYKLNGVINSHEYTTRKKFRTRQDAIEYMCKLLHVSFCLQEEYEREKHVIEYKFNETTRFVISRVLIA